MKTKILFLLFIFTLNSCQQHKKKKIIVEEITLNSIDLFPQYPGCKNFYEQAEQLNCLQEKIGNFINYSIKKYYKKDLLQLQDSIWLTLNIDSKGKTQFINLLQSGNEPITQTKYQQIFKQIAHKIPRLKPAVYHDKPVNFQFKIPIVMPRKQATK